MRATNNNNVSLSNIIASKNSEAKESVNNNSRMNDNAFLKREEVINNGVKLPENNSSNNGVVNNMTEKVSNNEYKPIGCYKEKCIKK